MYIVVKNFASLNLIGIKNKVIEIKDNDFASNLLNAGYIKEYVNAGEDLEESLEIIENLNQAKTELETQVSNLTESNEQLTQDKTELETQVTNLNARIEELEKEETE